MLSVSKAAVARYIQLKLSSNLVLSTRFYATAENTFTSATKTTNVDSTGTGSTSAENQSRFKEGRYMSNTVKNILELNEKLSQEINNAGSLTESYNRFNNLILDFESKHNNPQIVSNGGSVFNNTKILNSTITR